MSKRNIVFHETLTVSALIGLIIFNREAFFNRKSIALRVMERLFPIDVYRRGRRISWGDLNVSTGIRRKAYEAAKLDLKAFSGEGIDNNFPSLQSINKRLILKKIYFSERYDVHEFYEMAFQFAEENGQLKFKMYIDCYNKNCFEKKAFNKKISILCQYSFRRFNYILSVILVPLYILSFIKDNKSNDSLFYKNAIICEVDQSSTYRMFLELFKMRNNVYYVAQKHYMKYFTDVEIAENKIVVKGISLTTAKKIIKLPFEYFNFCLSNFVTASGYGWLYFHFLKTIVQGYLFTIDAKDSAYLTFEHLDPTKAVRNELLRLNNNRTIFVPKNNYISSRYLATEFKFNYDIFCSPCPCQETIYNLQDAETKIVLHVGIYDSHKARERDCDFENRINRLKEFKGNSIAITICSNGIMDETLRGEVGLMKLACRLASEHNVKVFIRPKPGEPPLKYKNFFIDSSACCDSIMLTGSEYLLSDFLGVTDLFVTSSSSSVTDLCPAGAEFFSVDFWMDSDQFLWQTVVDGVFISEELAFDKIINWVNDEPMGQRFAHTKRMERLRVHIAYEFNNFEAYKANFHRLLAPYLPIETVIST